MPLVADRTKETTITTGTGTLTLQGAPTGFQTFTAAFGNGVSVYYVIAGGSEYEIGIGTTGAGTLSRDTVLQSTNADALVPFSAGLKDVFCAYVAQRAVTTSDAATLTNKTIDDYTNTVGANSTHFRVKASGTLAKGAVIKAVGYTPGEQAIEVTTVASASEPSIGIMEQALTAGQFGTAVVIGELLNVNTNGFSVNQTLYSNGAGGFTSTKPSSGLYQVLGWVVRANASNGVIAVNVVSPLYVEASTSTANTTVLRDGSANFAAGTITAALTGNASTATALQTARAINGVNFDGTDAITVTAAAGTLSGATLAAGVTGSSLTSVGTLANLTVTNPISGSVTGSSASTTGNAATATALQTARTINGTSFNGTANITVTAATPNALTLGTGLTGTSFTGSAAVTATVDATNLNTASKIVARDASGNFAAGTITAALTGNASTATTLATARNINGVSFNGSADITVTAAAGTLSGATLASGVTASSLTSVGTLTALTMGGTINSADNVINRPRFTDYAETYTTPAISAGTLTLNIENGNVFRVSRNANISTVTISNPAATGNASSFTLIFDANGTSYTITWPAAVKWPGGTAPTITTTASRSDVFVFYTNNAGTTWYAMTAAQNFVTA
jgi:hypothetical protein